MFLQMKDENNFIGVTVNNLNITGTLNGNAITLQMKVLRSSKKKHAHFGQFQGKWEQNDECWFDDEFAFVIQINGTLKVQGTKFEGKTIPQ